MSVAFFPAWISVHHVHACCLQRSEEDIRSSGTWDRGGCVPASGCWEPNPCSLQKQLVPLTVEPSFQLHSRLFWKLEEKIQKALVYSVKRRVESPRPPSSGSTRVVHILPISSLWSALVLGWPWLKSSYNSCLKSKPNCCYFSRANGKISN